MKTVNIGTLKNQLSAYLRYVKNGEEVVIRDRNVPVARIVPIALPEEGDYAAEEAYLIATGQMKPAQEKIDRKAFWKLPRPVVSDEAVKEALDWVRGEY
jgi:prevent-host-death family protein